MPTHRRYRHWLYGESTTVTLFQLFEGDRLCIGRHSHLSRYAVVVVVYVARCMQGAPL